MSTLRVKDLIKELAVNRSVELDRLFAEGERRGIPHGIILDSVGRMASEGILAIKDGVVRIK
jgi:hypothetical protein